MDTDEHGHDDPTPSPAGPRPVVDPAVAQQDRQVKRRTLDHPLTAILSALIAGMIIGGAVVAASMDARPERTATPDTTATGAGTSSAPTSSPRAAPCKALSGEAAQLQELVVEMAEAAADLDAARLSALVRRLDDQQQLVARSAAECSAATSD